MTMTMSPGAWGAGAWGASPWAGPVPSPTFTLASAMTIRENVIRVRFSVPVYFSEIFDQYDAADPSHYAIATVSTSLDSLNEPTREVNIIGVRAVTEESIPPIEEGDVSEYVDVYLDRAMSSYPSQYDITISNIGNAAKTYIIPTAVMRADAVYRELQKPSLEVASEVRDIAMPQTLVALNEASPDELSLIGSFAYDDSGDYAFDEGNTGRKKRVFRRAITAPNGFMHLPGYGLGIFALGKKLGRIDTIGKFTSDARLQFEREPDIQKCIVTADYAAVGLLRLHVSIKPLRAQSQKFTLSFPVK